MARRCPAEKVMVGGSSSFRRFSFAARCLGLAILLGLVILPRVSSAHFLPWRADNDEPKRRAQARGIPVPSELEVMDQPNDDGSALQLSFTFEQPEETTAVMAQVTVDGTWYDAAGAPTMLAEVPTHKDLPRFYSGDALTPEHRDYFSLSIDGVMLPGEGGELEHTPLNTGQEYKARLMVYKDPEQETAGRVAFSAGEAIPTEQWFNAASLNMFLTSVIFALILLVSILAARSNPNLFIRRIAGLEAVDEAIGRATEMGRPVMQVNGLDPLTSAATVAAVNILGRIARRVASFDSHLMVPCVDPVVMTVSQETVKQAYAEAGRPDAYRHDSVFFVTDQQFSYVASVCGMMVRDKPAAIVYLGAFYAESLLLAETGAGTGAIQIAGTDSQHQLPFFVTTCDYTLIGEELYAASAYLSREPMLLGSLKGLDIAKAIVMGLVLLGTVAATFGADFMTRWFTPLQ